MKYKQSFSELTSKLTYLMLKSRNFLTNLIKNHETWLKYLLKLCFLVVFYGVSISFVLTTLLNEPFGIARIISWGIVSYFLKVEIPDIINKSFPKSKSSGGYVFDTK